MKRLTSYMKWMLSLGAVSFVLAVISFNLQLPDECAIMTVASFIFLWVASMAPDHEKYKS